jgi:hypothetical protein
MRRGLALLALAGLLQGCGGARPAAEGPALILAVEPASPASLISGTIVKVSARPQPAAELAWVSGTVKVFGAKPLALKKAADGSWGFKTMVPPLVTVPRGTYEIKAWGRTQDGKAVEGRMNYEVK